MCLSWFWSRRPPPRPDSLHLVMYTRGGCHLCEAVWDLLQKRQRTYGFTFETIDVDGNPELAACYGLEVPVVMVNGKVYFRGGVNEVLLERLLRAEAGRKPTKG